MEQDRRVDRKVNLLVAVAGLGIGGAEVVIQRLVQTIDRSLFNVTICCIKGRGLIGDQLVRDGFDVVVLPAQDTRRVNYLRFISLYRLILQRRIDVVHTHSVDALVDAATCKLLRSRLKLIHTFHFGNYPHVSKRILWMERICSRLASRLIAVGEVQRQQLRSTYGFRESAIEKVSNGVLFLPPADGREFRDRLGVKDHVLVGTTATLIEQKGLFDLLSVAHEFRHEADKVRFVVIGDGPLRSKLEARRDELGLTEIVTFAGWIANAAHTALPAFDVFFQPSLWEAMSIAVLEAMAAGKPVVATRVGENGHLIAEEVDGLLVRPRDIAGMAQAIRRLVARPELRRLLGENAVRKVTQQFTIEKMTRAYERVYLDVL